MPVTIGEYNRLIRDRPIKFTAAEVGFESQATDGMPCHECLHYYIGEIAKRNVCEIYAPRTERRHVPPEATCMFWTKDGTKFPKMR